MLSPVSSHRDIGTRLGHWIYPLWISHRICLEMIGKCPDRSDIPLWTLLPACLRLDSSWSPVLSLHMIAFDCIEESQNIFFGCGKLDLPWSSLGSWKAGSLWGRFLFCNWGPRWLRWAFLGSLPATVLKCEYLHGWEFHRHGARCL